MSRDARKNGGALILVLVAVALLLSLVLSSATALRQRWALAADNTERTRGRQAALSNVAVAVHFLDSDPRPTTHLAGLWRQPANTGGILLSDEEARLDLRTANIRAISALLQIACGKPAGEADEAAKAFAAWRDALPDRIETVEQLYQAPGFSPETISLLWPHITVFGSGSVNINTAGEEVTRALLASAGADRETAQLFLRGLLSAREKGVICADASPAGLSMLILGEGRIPKPNQAQVFTAVAPLLDVRSTTFGGFSRSPGTRHRIHFIYNTADRRFYRWAE